MKILTQAFPYEEHKLLNSIPKSLLEMNEDIEFYIAGGMITSLFTNREINDIDVYLKSFDDLITLLKVFNYNGKILSATNKSVMIIYNENKIDYKINIIYFDFFDVAEDIFKCFDFTCVMGVYDVRHEKFLFHESFFLHNSQRRLVFNKSTNYPLMSLFRVKKYVDRDYEISKNEYLRIVLKCMTLNITSYNELEDHIGGMYGLDLKKVIDTTKPFDLSFVIDQISEVIQDFDTGENTYKNDEKHFKNVIDGVILTHKIKQEENIFKIKINDSYFFMKDKELYGISSYYDRYFDTIPDYKDNTFIVFKELNISKRGDVGIYYNNNYKFTSIVETSGKIIYYTTKTGIIHYLKENKNDFLYGRFEVEVSDFIGKPTIFKTCSIFNHYDNSFQSENGNYLDMFKIDNTEIKEEVNYLEIKEKYEKRVNKMSNKNRLTGNKIKVEKENSDFPF